MTNNGSIPQRGSIIIGFKLKYHLRGAICGGWMKSGVTDQTFKMNFELWSDKINDGLIKSGMIKLNFIWNYLILLK